MVSDLEPDILEFKVKWALRSNAVNKASGCDEIPAELFKSPKMMPSKCHIHYVSKSGRPSSDGKDWKRSIFIPIPKGSTKECANHRTIALISHASKVMLKVLHARLQHYANQELPDVQAGFRKGRGTRDRIANIPLIIEKAREFQKNIYLCFLGYAKPLTACIMTNCGKLLKRWKYQTILPVS